MSRCNWLGSEHPLLLMYRSLVPTCWAIWEVLETLGGGTIGFGPPGHVLRGCILSHAFLYLSLYFLVTMKYQLCSPYPPSHDTLFHHSLKRLELAEQKLKPETMSHNDLSSFKLFCQEFSSVRRADQYSREMVNITFY